jgi:nicotinamide-nucleotide amidase
MRAELITIGDEILIGQIIDTNSAWMGEKLNEAGIDVTQITSVPDNKDRILQALFEAEKRADLVLITGGLGPTKDDITKHVLCDFFQTKLKRHPEILVKLDSWFKNRGREMSTLNECQADLPENCTILPNRMGTASGMWFEKNEVIFISMPGVPYEMKCIMEEEALPKIISLGKTDQVIHRTILTAGLPESILAQKVEDIETTLPPSLKLAYLPKPGLVRLRLTAKGAKNENLSNLLLQYGDEIKSRLSDVVFGEGKTTLSQAVGNLLLQKNARVGLAESCTGGFLSSLFVEVPGSSQYYEGSVVVYSYELKSKFIGVRPETLLEFGAVSEEVVREMALGTQKSMGVDYSIAISGIAGPDGGTDDKPVGTVWMAISGPNKIITHQGSYGSVRSLNIERSAMHALFLLWSLLKEENDQLKK